MIRIETVRDSLSLPPDKQNGPGGVRPAKAEHRSNGVPTMQHNGTSVLDRPEVSQVSPVITGPKWFECNADGEHPRTVSIRAEVPMSADLMVAALYLEGQYITAADLATDDLVWGYVAIAITHEGLWAVERQAEALACADKRGMVGRNDWLAFVRQRVADVTGGVR